MKFLLPLLALISVAKGQVLGPFILGNPLLALDDTTKPIITVSYTNTRLDPSGNANDVVMGTTVQGYAKECVGEYISGSFIDGLSLSGITDDYIPDMLPGGGSISQYPSSYNTAFKVTVDPSEVPADIFDGEPATAATIKFCLITGLEAVGGPLVDFTETEVTIAFNLVDDVIDSFLFTAKTESASNYAPDAAITIDTITQACNSPPHYPAAPGGVVDEQGVQVCFEVCVDNTNQVGTDEDWRVSSLFNVQASGNVGDPATPIIQPLTNANQLVTWWAPTGKCFQVVFYPNAAYYTYAGNVVTISGGARMTRLTGLITRRLRNMDHRVLEGLEAADGEFEMQVELEGKDDGSAAISIKQISFAAGVAGVALLV